jgi:hypothetical protein
MQGYLPTLFLHKEHINKKLRKQHEFVENPPAAKETHDGKT